MGRALGVCLFVGEADEPLRVAAVSGVCQVTASIHTTGLIYDCFNSPTLVDDVYLY